MPQLELAGLPVRIEALEQMRDSRVLVLAASNLDMELLPQLFEQCRALGHVPRLDVLLHGRGGVVNAARRIALLLRQYADHLAFIVPFHCESAATLLTLCADEVVAGEMAMFSPFDPLLSGTDGTAFSGLDIKLLGDMAAQWFCVDESEARQQSLALLCNSIFPPTLTAFYRTTLEVAQIGQELLAYQLPDQDADVRRRIVEQLMSGYHSHNYALTREEMETIGLRMRRHAEAENAAWEISTVIQAHIGGAVRETEQAAWNDTLLATRDGVMVRQKQPGAGLTPRWSAIRRPS